MKLPSFKEIYNASKEVLDEKLSSIVEARLKAQATVEKAKLQEDIHTQEIAITKMLSEANVDFSKLIDAMNKVELAERRVKQYDVIINELFPAADKASAS